MGVGARARRGPPPRKRGFADMADDLIRYDVDTIVEGMRGDR